MQDKETKGKFSKLTTIWAGLLPTPPVSSVNPEPIRIRIEATLDYIDKLEQEAERRGAEKVVRNMLRDISFGRIQRDLIKYKLDNLSEEENGKQE